MPRGDKTGPLGGGPRTGRGLGNCMPGSDVAKAAIGLGGLGMGLGLACRRRFAGSRRGNGGRRINRMDSMGRGFRRRDFSDENFTMSDKEVLESQKDLLNERLNIINEELENL